MDGRSHIYRLEKKGIWNASKRYWGDCFVVFKLTNDPSKISPYVTKIDDIQEGQMVYQSMTLNDLQDFFIP